MQLLKKETDLKMLKGKDVHSILKQREQGIEQCDINKNYMFVQTYASKCIQQLSSKCDTHIYTW